jgi:tripartite-type tricarboxylate transporter receptor subunit TctC
MNKFATALVSFGAAGAMTLPAALPACAQTPVAFFKDKTIKIMVGHTPGGGFDAYARLAGEMLKKHVEGIAATVVENKPGGGGLIAAAFFYANGAKDGTMMASFPEQLANTQVLEPAIAKWKIEEMRYVGSFAPANSGLLLRRGAPVKTVADMLKTQSNVGCAGVTSQGFQYPAMLKNLGGFKFRMVCGYPGSPEYLLALEKGEVDIASNAWNALRISHLKQIETGEVILFAQGGLSRDPEIKDVPLLQDLVDDIDAKRAIAFASSGAAIGRSLLLPPGVPADRVAYLRAVFDRMVSDPDMIAVAKQRQLTLNPTPGAEVDKIVQDILKAPKDLVEKAALSMK